MPHDARSPEIPSRARRHFLGLTAAAIGVLGSSALSSAAQAEPDNPNKGSNKGGNKESNKGKSAENKHEGRGAGVGSSPGDANCFLQGTVIRTSSGEVPVEELRIGDLVETVSGQALPIRWIGRQSFKTSRAAWRESVMPIRVARGALGPQMPHRDLYLSPGHALLLDGVLIPAQELVNGTSIAPALPDACEAIEYFQILLATHEAILAEGVPAETFLPDRRNHETFSNFVEYERLYPGEPWPVLAPCAPAVCRGGREHLKALVLLGLSHVVRVQDPFKDAYERLDNVRQRLAERTEELVS
jgi:hypothetical protein